ncbi:MAG: mismatch repair protein MutH [Pseudomonadota bacterium]|nr:mismatch repair protein MutH [Pseudomonadota bacterium]
MSFPLQVQQILHKAQELEGLTFLQLARMLNLQVPHEAKFAKGWLGQAIELYLGAQAGCLPIPDFPSLKMELKSLPINSKGRVMESTYVTTLPLLGDFSLNFEQSHCFQKLQLVLWLPIEGERTISYAQRRIGRAILWQPNDTQYAILKKDWEDIIDMVIQGNIEKIHGGLGKYLHIRPKAADSKALTKALNEQSEMIQTLPRGFYLRTLLTQDIFEGKFVLG